LGTKQFYCVPLSDEYISPGDPGDSDDDGREENFPLASGKKMRVKKPKKRVWYAESRANPHEKICLESTFIDAYQFRIALRTFHIAYPRNFEHHRNNKDMIIAKCSEKGCPFYITTLYWTREDIFHHEIEN
jgi:hypothetical protein